MADPTGFVAFSSDPVMTAEPSWNDVSLAANIQRITTDRGRSYELDKTGTGTAVIELVDIDGSFDPTQTASLTVDILHHVAICLHNPYEADPDTDWSPIFRGYVSSIQWAPYQSENVANVRIECVDAFAILAATEMAPDGTFGDSVEDGSIVFEAIDSLDACQTRINGLLDQAGWPSALRQIFTGNIWLQDQWCAARTDVLSVILDIADAEFPGVANVYVSRYGEIVFHGRFARFDPVTTSTDTDWDFQTWKLGNDAAAVVDPTNTVRISPPLNIYRDDAHIYTSAIALPQNRATGLTNAEIAGQYVTDPTGVTAYGLRTWSANNLLTGPTDSSGSTTELEATKLFADYYVDNYAEPRTRVGQITVKAKKPGSPNGPQTWAFLRGVEISDVVELSTDHFGYTAFSDTPFYVEGIHYEIEAQTGYPNEIAVTCVLDVSPVSYFDSNPFE